MALPAALLPWLLGSAAAALTGYGAKKGYDGYQDKSKANELVQQAEHDYQQAKKRLDSTNKTTEAKMELLGSLQLQIGQEFKEFEKLAEELLQKLKKSSDRKDWQLSIPQHKLDGIKQLEISTTAFLAHIAGGGVAGAAAAYATYGGVMALASASTGTSIATLSGIVAHNATMAAIGGGAVSAGGLGMAGGSAILGGIVAAPVVAALGWAYANHAEKALANARKTEKQAREIVEKIDMANLQSHRIREYAEKIYSETSRIHDVFMAYFGKLKEMHQLLVSPELNDSQKEERIKDLDDSIMTNINNGYMLAAILTDIITTPLFKVKKDKNGKVLLGKDNAMEFEEDSHGNKIINTEGIALSLQNADAKMKKVPAISE